MYLNRAERRSLAWAMLDLVGGRLVPDDRAWMCVEIGAGDLESVLIALVGTGMRNGVVVPDEMLDALREWLRGYSGTEVAAAFTPYLGEVSIEYQDVTDERPQQATRPTCNRFVERPRRVSSGLAVSGSLWRME